jgi:hypothetical protein
MGAGVERDMYIHRERERERERQRQRQRGGREAGGLGGRDRQLDIGMNLA